jgi:hypothetical protein
MISKQTWSKYHISDKDRIILENRDKKCVYCHIPFSFGKAKDSVEHIENETWKKNPAVLGDLAICCMACNASKSELKLLDWFEKSYCKEGKNSTKKIINKDTVSLPIRDWIKVNCK